MSYSGEYMNRFNGLYTAYGIEMKRKNMILIAIIAAYLLFLWDCKITYLNKKSTYKIEYLGLLWVGLDYWTVWKYHSINKPRKWISYTKSEYYG